MKQQRKNKHLLPAILTVLAILSSLLGILPAGSVSAADVTAYPAQAVHFGAYTTNRNLNNAGSAANTQKAAGTNSEDWRIDYVSAGVYQIVSLADGKYLTANGTACTLTAKAADSSQSWNIESVQKDFEGYDLYYKITSVSTGAALTYYQGNNTIGLTAYTGDGAQKWKLNCSGLEGDAANALANGKEKAGTIGGLLGETVFVSTADDLEKQLNTTEPKTIVITADIDMQNKSHTRIRDNKTIVGSYGNKTIYDSQFRTNDTYGAVNDNPSDNIIFRNLNMIAKNVKNRILINIWSSRQIWVDHCTFISYLPSDHTGNGQDEVGKFIWLNTPYESYLDAKDNGRSPDYITISYNTFKNRFWTVAYGTQNSETSRCRTTLMYNWWDECVRRCPQIGNGSGHIYNNYYSGDDSFLPNSCNQIISGEGSNMVSENCRFQAVSGREIIVQPDTSPYRDNGSYTAKSSSETPTKLNYTAKVTSTWNPKDNYGYTLLDAYNTRGTDTKDFCTKYAGAASSSGELKYITDSSLQTFAATVYTAPFLTDSFDSAYGNPVTDYTPAVLQEGAVYMIQNVNSGLYLEVANGSAEAGANLQQWGADSAAAHNTWRAISAGDGYYYLYSQVGDQITYLMDISGGKADNGTNAALWTKSSREQAQQFLFALNEDGSYTIYTKASNLKSCIEVENASKSSGANVQQYESNGNACQHWILEETAAAGVKLDTSQVYQFQNANSALYLEVKDASAEAGANVQQWGANGNDCQNWTLKEFGDGYYYILSRLGDGKTYYLDVAEGKGDDGTNIQIFTNTKTSAQLFKFIPNPDGTYYIVTRASKDKGALGVAAASKEQGANVLQWTKNGSMDQMWNITAIGAIPTPVTTTEPPVVTTEAPTETTTAAPVLTTEATTETTTAVPVMTTEAPAETTAAAPAATKATTKATTTKKTSEVPSSTVLYGDTNLDGRVDITDAVLLNKAVANAVTLSSAARQNSDCRQDGELTSDDAVVLMQFLVHIVTNLPQ